MKIPEKKEKTTNTPTTTFLNNYGKYQGAGLPYSMSTYNMESNSGFPVKRLKKRFAMVETPMPQPLTESISSDNSFNNSHNCLSHRLVDTAHIAPPPLGYYIREDSSTDNCVHDCVHEGLGQSSSQEKTCEHALGCNFTQKSLTQNQLYKPTKEIDKELLSTIISSRKSSIRKMYKKKINRNNAQSPTGECLKIHNNIINLSNGSNQTGNKSRDNSFTNFQRKLMKSKDYSTPIKKTGNLPFTVDSIFYGNGKTNHYMRYNNNRKQINVSKEKNIRLKSDIGKFSTDQEVRTQQKICKKPILTDYVFLNTNVNANTPDIDIQVDEEKNNLSTRKCDENVTIKHEFQNHLTQESTAAYKNDSIGKEGSLLENNCPLDGLASATKNDMLLINVPSICDSSESIPETCGIDFVIDDFIKRASEEETKQDACFDELIQLTNSSQTRFKNGTFNVRAESNSLTSMKNLTDEQRERKSNIPQKLGAKSSVRFDLSKAYIENNKRSVSSPNISLAALLESGSKQETSVVDTEESEQIQTSPEVEHETKMLSLEEHIALIKNKETENAGFHQKKDTLESTSLECDLPVNLQNCFDVCEEKKGLKKILQQKEERGRSKMSKCVSLSSTSGVIKTSRSASREMRRTQSQTGKSRGKKKSLMLLKKSISASPCHLKRSRPESSTSLHRSKSGEHKELTNRLHKKSPTLKPTKKKKKVRIAIELFHLNQLSQTNRQSSLEHQKGKDKQNHTCDDEDTKGCLKPKRKLKSDSAEKIKSLKNEQLVHEWEETVEDKDDIEEQEQKNGEEEEGQIKKSENCYESVGMCEMSKFDSLGSIDDSPSTTCDTTPLNTPVMNVKQCKGAKIKKSKSCNSDKSAAEKGWVNNVVAQQKGENKGKDSKKRYILKKKHNKQINRSKEQVINEKSNEGEENNVNVKEKESTHANNADTTTVKKLCHKPATNRRHYHSPKLLRKTKALLTDPKEGSSVDAPGFNSSSKRDGSLRTTRSGPSLGVGKQNTKEGLVNTPTRFNLSRDNSRAGKRNEKNHSISEQASPLISQSTDLDIACGSRRQQWSPTNRVTGLGRLTRIDSKVIHNKFRSKSEPDDYKQKPVVTIRRNDCQRTVEQFTDPMDKNVLNVGLSWMVQGLINRLPFFQSRVEEHISESPQTTDHVGEVRL